MLDIFICDSVNKECVLYPALLVDLFLTLLEIGSIFDISRQYIRTHIISNG